MTCNSQLKSIALKIYEALEKRRNYLNLSFTESSHQYEMNDVNGKLQTNWPSVSDLKKTFSRAFDAEKIALKKSKGDKREQQRLLQEWKAIGTEATDLGSRVHFFLEKKSIKLFSLNKKIRKPEYAESEKTLLKSKNMIQAGYAFLNEMHKRKMQLIDTEIVLGDPELGYVGQPDCIWLAQNPASKEICFIISDYKTNNPKKFKPNYFTKKMFKPFETYDDIALNQYFIQLAYYIKLFSKMLQNTEYEKLKFLGGTVVLLKEDKTFIEYMLPHSILNKIMKL